jgi:hypothetical protein
MNNWVIKFEKKSKKYGSYLYNNYFYLNNKINLSHYYYATDYIILDKYDFLYYKQGLIITKYSKSFKFMFNMYKKLKDFILPIIIFNSFLMTNSFYLIILSLLLYTFSIYYITINILYYIMYNKEIKYAQNIINYFNDKTYNNNDIKKWIEDKIILLNNY